MGSAEEKIVVAGTVGNDSRIKQFAATGTFPGIERPDEVIEFLGEHSAFAFRTFHNVSPSIGMVVVVWLTRYFTLRAKRGELAKIRAITSREDNIPARKQQLIEY